MERLRKQRKKQTKSRPEIRPLQARERPLSAQERGRGIPPPNERNAHRARFTRFYGAFGGVHMFHFLI